MQSCYLAGPGTVDQVNILREGTDGAEMKVVPINPVVVELVKERYCFVASRDVLFEDPELAGLEAERLRVEDAELRRKRRKEIQQMIDSTDSDQSTGGDIQPQPPNLTLVSAPQEEETIEVDALPEVIDIEPEPEFQGVTNIEPEPELPVDTAEVDSNPASPTNFLRNAQRVIGNETLPLAEVHTRLKDAGLMPGTDDPIGYIRWRLSGNRHLFERPTRMSVCLAADNPFLAQPWNPEVPTKKKAKKKSSKTETQPMPLGTVKKKSKKKPVEQKPLKINPAFLNWLGNPMVQKVADKASFEGDEIRLLEQQKGNNWVCEILLVAMKLSFVGESKMRHHARHKAEANMTGVTLQLNILVHRAHHPEET